MKKPKNTFRRLTPLLTLSILVLIWELGVRFYEVAPWILPGPVQVFKALVSSFDLLLVHTATTFYEASLGFFLSIILALVVAFILTSVDWLNRAFYPLLIVSQTIPLIILAVLFTIWFGWGLLPKVIIVVLVCFFPITINLINGLKSVDPDQVNLFHSMGANNWDVFKIVKFPHALPSLFTGLKISATYSVMAAVIGEWLGAKQGLGYFMTIQQKNFAIDQVIAAVVVISVISLALVKLIEIIEYFLVPWNRKNEL
ncbi:MAG TPA: ABC transporter permease [Syntrophomonadaceae bacterium]|nr:ABC transporter permease [Syntrophomonadaceae bacterium]